MRFELEVLKEDMTFADEKKKDRSIKGGTTEKPLTDSSMARSN